eukprot:scaffold1442_cov128-Cylindrotheca_fusiformis.AAC.40
MVVVTDSTQECNPSTHCTSDQPRNDGEIRSETAVGDRNSSVFPDNNGSGSKSDKSVKLCILSAEISIGRAQLPVDITFTTAKRERIFQKVPSRGCLPDSF